MAQKGVEEAFVYWYAARIQNVHGDRFQAIIIPTKRNQPLRDSFSALPFDVVDTLQNGVLLEFIIPEDLQQPDLIRVEDAT